MEIILLYAISIGGVLVILVVSTCLNTPSIYDYLVFNFLQYAVYPLIVQRRYWTSVTWLEAVLLCGYVIANGVCMGVYITSIDDLIIRSAKMATINMVPLFLGSRTSFFADRVGIPLHSYYLAHHWVGRICVAQGLLHAVLVLTSRETRNITSGILLTSTLTLILFSSLYFVRKLMFEMFLKLHHLIALTTIGVLFWHLDVGSVKIIFPAISLLFWLLNRLPHLLLRQRTKDASISKIYHFSPCSNKEVSAIRLEVKLRRPMHIRPGQYFYIQFLGGARHLDRLQSHPFMAMPVTSAKNAESLAFLIQPQYGLSSRLMSNTSLHNAVLYGPYGKDLQLRRYETVILVAEGIGIAGILPYAHELTSSKANSPQTVLTRKLDVYWLLEDNCQEEWICDYLQTIKQIDTKSLLQFWCFYPQTKTSEPKMKVEDNMRFKYIYPETEYISIPVAIKKVTNKSSGENMVVACGSPALATIIRDDVRDLNGLRKFFVHFAEVEYRPHGPHSYQERSKYLQKKGAVKLRRLKKISSCSSIVDTDGDIGNLRRVEEVAYV